jgi:hypothetical protein
VKTKNLKRKRKAQPGGSLEPVGSGIPTNWLDPLLTGPKAVIGRPPYDCRDIERLLGAIRKRMFPNFDYTTASRLSRAGILQSPYT